MVEENLPSGLAELSEEPLVVTNFHLMWSWKPLISVMILISSKQLQLMQLCHYWKRLSSFHY